jgi:hypothetical protein
LKTEFERASVSTETRDAIERGVALLVPNHSAVRVVVTANFEQAVRRELAEHPEAGTFTADRLGGVVAGKTICGKTESVIVLDAQWLQPGEDHPDPYRLLAHEGGHVALHQRGETADGRRRLVRSRADWMLLAGAATALEEYRIERALYRLGLPAHTDYWSGMPDTLFEFVDQFVDGLVQRYPNEPIKRTHDTMIGAAHQLAVALHYLAAQGDGELPDDPYARGFWRRFVSPTWPTLTALSSTVPDATTSWPTDQLDARLLRLTAHRRDWFARLGFRLEPDAHPEDYYFRVLLTDDDFQAILDEGLAAERFYRQRDAS